MPAFWLLFWLAFYLTPIAYFISQGSISSGSSSSGSHIWVYKGSKTKVRDATRREVWERQHPGRNWGKSQNITANFFLAFLLIILFFSLFAFAENTLKLPEDDYQRHLHKGGSTIFGIVTSAVYWPLVFTFVWEMKSRTLSIVRWIALAAGPVLVIAFLVLTLRNTVDQIPISYHWIWLSPVLVVLLGYADKTFVKTKREKAIDGGNKLGGWALDMMFQMTDRGIGSVSFDKRYGLRDTMKSCTNLINTGKMDDLLGDQQRFKDTERILLDLVSGRQMAITMDEIYVAREEIIKAVQAFYFRAVKSGRKNIHPDIQAALKK